MMRRSCFVLSVLSLFLTLQGKAQTQATSILPHAAIAARQFGGDAAWYERNIPFFDCSDPEITQVYYYRWKLYKAHLRDLGDRGYIVTEFLNDVGWAKQPYQSLNDATAFHISEGRWLNDRHYVDDYIDYMYTGGGNDRHFSEAIAAAVYAHYLVDGDRTFAVKHLDVMQHIYHLWDDHYDFSKGLYFIEPLLDATEYTISSIDATGGQDGFVGGDAFRPTINSFMYADAGALSKLAALSGDPRTAADFAARATALRQAVEKSLWSDAQQHFIDRYKVTNSHVRTWDFIRGRELAGYTPWYFGLPDGSPRYAEAWRHLLSPAELAGPYGIRTVEPSYQYYMKQYRYDWETKKRECQWNGPSWPFQTTLALGGLANLLNDTSQNVIHADDYVRLLKQYTRQHYQDGQLDLQEDYDPDTGKVIVGLSRSHHYNHSCYNDLVITGLVGLRPRADNILEVHPLISSEAGSPDVLRYFCLENVLYHGQRVTILYDRDGSHYKRGAGLSVYVNGRQVVAHAALGKKMVAIPPPPVIIKASSSIDQSVTLNRPGDPLPTASFSDLPEAVSQAVDGRVWYFSNVRNYWSDAGSPNATDWFRVDFGHVRTVHSAALYFYSDGIKYLPPKDYTLQTWTGKGWAGVTHHKQAPTTPLGNGENTVTFAPVRTSQLRAVFTNPKAAAVALVEIKVY